jgi:hypothetical protein
MDLETDKTNPIGYIRFQDHDSDFYPAIGTNRRHLKYDEKGETNRIVLSTHCDMNSFVQGFLGQCFEEKYDVPQNGSPL